MKKNSRRTQFYKFAVEHSICQQEGPEYKSYRNDKQDATVSDNLLFHCSLIAQHVSSVIIINYQELLNYNYSFWFYSRLSLSAADKRE